MSCWPYRFFVLAQGDNRLLFLSPSELFACFQLTLEEFHLQYAAKNQHPFFFQVQLCKPKFHFQVRDFSLSAS
jgi:hypothetical protein